MSALTITGKVAVLEDKPQALSGPLATSAAWRWVGAGDTAVSNVFGPL
jgi:hypothetical protein